MGFRRFRSTVLPRGHIEPPGQDSARSGGSHPPPHQPPLTFATTDAAVTIDDVIRAFATAEPLDGDAVSSLVPAGVDVEYSRGDQPAYWWLIAAE